MNTISKTFISYYGGLESARYLTQNIISLPSSLSSSKQYKSSIQGLAERMLLCKSQNRTFRIGFTGYNAVTARGNIHMESFTYFLSDMLQEPIFQLLQIPIHVINVGMANISPFPYGWCLNEIFLKQPLDVIMLDVSLTKYIHGVEAFLRNAAQLYGNPIIIWRDIPIQDNNKDIHARKDIFESYIQKKIIPSSSFIFNTISNSIIKPYLVFQPQSRPPGFQQWYDYNIPFHARTEKTKFHPTAQEHQLMGWILGLHFLTALQWIADNENHHFKTTNQTSLLPPPFTNITHYHTLSYGSPLSYNHWYMKQRHCYTSFRPPFQSLTDSNMDYMTSISNHHLSNIIQSGTVADYLNILLPKGPMFYNRGWVLDMISEHKQKMKQQTTLGYKDYKVAYFGLKASQKLSFFLPHSMKEKEMSASLYFTSLTICGITDYNSIDACKMDTDMVFYIDGIQSSNVSFVEGEEVSYLGSQLCVLVDIPKDSNLSIREPKQDTITIDINEAHMQLNNENKIKLDEDEQHNLGLKLEIEVVNPKVSLKTGPCSVSHVIWEV